MLALIAWRKQQPPKDPEVVRARKEREAQQRIREKEAKREHPYSSAPAPAGKEAYFCAIRNWLWKATL